MTLGPATLIALAAALLATLAWWIAARLSAPAWVCQFLFGLVLFWPARWCACREHRANIACTCEHFPVINDACSVHGGASETVKRVAENARRTLRPLSSSTYNPADVARIIAEQQRKQLQGMSFDLIQAEVERRGHQVCLHTICRFSADRLPAGADE